MNLTRRVFWNSASQFGGKLVVLASMILCVRLTTGYLGPAGFGEYAIVLALAPVLFIVAELGLSSLLARELARRPGERDELAGTMLAFRLVGSSAVVGLALAAIPFLPYDREVRIGTAIAAVGVLLLSLSSFVVAFFQVELRLELVAVMDVVTALVTAALVVAVTQLDLGFYALVAVAPAAAVVNLVLGFALVGRFWRPRLRWSRGLVRPLLGAAVPIALVTTLGMLHFKIDAVLLSLLKPAEDVGIYNVAFRFFEYSLVLPGIFMAAVFPILTRALASNLDEARAVIEKALDAVLLVAVPLALGTLVLAPVLVELVAPSGFEAAVTPLRILSLGLVFAFANAVFAGAALALDRQRALVAVSAAGLALNVALNLLLIPRYSYSGAAAATVVTEMLGCVAVFALARAACPFSLRPRFVTRADLRLVFGRS
jgi:O-antigen/teichoic acid export membrane protein